MYGDQDNGIHFMSGKKTNTFMDSDWLEIQQKYLEACQAFTQFTPVSKGKTDPTMNAVMDAMEYWWKSVSPMLPEGNAKFVNKILEQSRIYYTLGEQFVRLLNEMNKVDKSRHDWESLLNRQFEEIKTVFTKSDEESKETVHKMLGAWQLMPMDTLQRTFSLSSTMPGDFLGDLKRDSLQKVTHKFLSMPGVGYTRESQEQWQEGIRLWTEYQKICQEYNQALYKISIDAIDAMRQKILNMSKEGKEFKNLREIYDLWIDCNEESYASYVYTPEFSELYGRLTNALMAVKQHGRNIVDENLSVLNVPTYKGINTLQKRQYDMRREQKDTFKKIQDLQHEIAKLQGLVKQSGSSAAKTPSLSSGKNRSRKGKRDVNSNVGRTKRIKTSIPRKKTVQYAKKNDMIVIRI